MRSIIDGPDLQPLAAAILPLAWAFLLHLEQPSSLMLAPSRQGF